MYDKLLHFIESAVLFFSLFDAYPLALFLMCFSVATLALDLLFKFLPSEKEEEILKKYMNFPAFLIAFYILFGSYSSLKLAALLAGYGFLRVAHAHLRRWVYDREVPKMREENGQG